jgi:hypothetical protein
MFDTAVFSNMMRYSLAWGMGHGAWRMGLPRVPHKPAICCMFEREKGTGGEDLTSGEYGIEIYNLNAPQLN